MEDFWFYTKLGLDHVLDLNARDHILFLIALALPFSFQSWKKVLVLATVFTISHCISLVLSSYGLLDIEVMWIEFLIPVTIVMTAIFNLLCIQTNAQDDNLGFHVLATAFFGLIHGLGFSNYFKLLVADQETKLSPLLGFALRNRDFPSSHRDRRIVGFIPFGLQYVPKTVVYHKNRIIFSHSGHPSDANRHFSIVNHTLQRFSLKINPILLCCCRKAGILVVFPCSE